MDISFSTLNESNLHNSLKNYYAFKNNGKTEVKEEGFIFDIVTNTNEIIEIQTKNVSKLKDKVLFSIDNQRKLTIVHPIIIEKTVKLIKEDGELIHSRKSPVKKNIYSIFKEITGIAEFLPNQYITLELPFVKTTEIRIKTDIPVQNKTNTRRFKKDWIKNETKLNEINSVKQLITKKDYLDLLPLGLSDFFCTKDIKEAFKNNNIQQKIINDTNLYVWVLRKMGLIKQIDKKGNSIIYQIVK